MFEKCEGLCIKVWKEGYQRLFPSAKCTHIINIKQIMQIIQICKTEFNIKQQHQQQNNTIISTKYKVITIQNNINKINNHNKTDNKCIKPKINFSVY